MATGVTKNMWQETVQIISSEHFPFETDYEITYKGKTPEREIISTPYTEKYELLYGEFKENKLFYGDNLDVLRFLLQSGNLKNKVKLIYIDPPYGTNSVFQSRNQKDSYKDDLVGSHFIEFIRRRLILLRELLCDEGSIYVHLDSNMTSQIKIIMDEVFGAKNFRGFITRKKCSNKNSTRNSYGNISDYILFYSKTENFTWHRATAVWTDEKILKEYPCIDEATGRRYKKVPIHAPGIRNGETGKEWRGMLPPQGKHWQYTPEKLDEFDRKGEIYWSANGNPRRKVFLDMDRGIPVQDIWLDTQDSLNQNIKITGYPTEKNPDLLKRIIEASSNENDIVLDCFAGSGTTLGIAEQLGRKWIGVDNSSEAMDNILKRFFKGLEGMGDYVNAKNDSENTLFQTTLFEPTSSYGKALKTDFELLSDSRYSDLINDILEKYLNG
ncbi:MAG: site-specific DNA-methyltransferase [Chitinophagales bacterium]|nr:site-specific DNA-methyltransferase [Chitinophagales bacterium]